MKTLSIELNDCTFGLHVRSIEMLHELNDRSSKTQKITIMLLRITVVTCK